MYTHTYIYICICVCMCTYIYRNHWCIICLVLFSPGMDSAELVMLPEMLRFSALVQLVLSTQLTVTCLMSFSAKIGQVWCGFLIFQTCGLKHLRPSSTILKPSSTILKPSSTILKPSGYGSIPINTIFSGMNIHFNPAILMWTTGVLLVLTHCHMLNHHFQPTRFTHFTNFDPVPGVSPSEERLDVLHDADPPLFLRGASRVQKPGWLMMSSGIILIIQ